MGFVPQVIPPVTSQLTTVFLCILSDLQTEAFKPFAKNGLSKFIMSSQTSNKKVCITLLFVRVDIPARLISIEKAPIKSFFMELNLRKKKWIVNCSYNCNGTRTHNHLVRKRTLNHLVKLTLLLLQSPQKQLEILTIHTQPLSNFEHKKTLKI